MANSTTNPQVSLKIVAIIGFLFSLPAAAQIAKELNYQVGPKPLISITNDYGSITVQPSANNQVIVTMLTRSDGVSFSSEQRGNRVELRLESNVRGTELADCKVLVPRDSILSLRSSDGKLHAQGLSGDIILEAATAALEVTDISDAHIHVRTLSGPVTLSNIRHSHLDINSVSGDLRIRNVIDSTLDAHSGSGQITYDGDPGSTGDYTLTSHSGNLDVSIPATASVEIKSRSLRGEPDQDVANLSAGPATPRQNRFLPLRRIAASRFVLRSFKGRIRIRRP
ncbi:MAG TPA: DUF4097 family beta strand repeat-containing protein [Candidatus Sulfotelmatobacter sp.]|nr:DUF4097 family beta strand repeat-containing protein [Candidatus Sulfotelmatobacter sp.]